MKRTKIVATIGPACDSPKILAKMIKAGMNVARFNFSHGTYQSNKRAVENLRRAAKKLNQPIAIIQDLQGPRIRVGEIDKSGVELVKNEIITLVEDAVKRRVKPNGPPRPASTRGERVRSSGEADKVLPIQFVKLGQVLKVGSQVLLLDGLVELKVTAVSNGFVKAKVIKAGTIYSYKGVNIPGADLGLPVITKKDIQDLKFGLGLGVDIIAQSFVGSGEDLKKLKRMINKFQPASTRKRGEPASTRKRGEPASTRKRGEPRSQVMVMAKVERGEAVKNIKSIVKEADAVMVARGDLGIELNPVRVPIIQKEIVKMCLTEGKPVVVATQMLDSMIKYPRPTRAEVSDVANAVIDHADSVMLSGETAFGSYPVESVAMMSRIIEETEQSAYDDMPDGYFKEKRLNLTKAVSESVFELVSDVKAKAIVAATDSGFTARMIARFRPETRIIVLVNQEIIWRQLALSWGIYPEMMPVCKTMDELIDKSVKLVKKQRLVKKGDQIVIVTGQPVGRSKNMNLVKVQTI